jgi:hypothetical protein
MSGVNTIRYIISWQFWIVQKYASSEKHLQTPRSFLSPYYHLYSLYENLDIIYERIKCWIFLFTKNKILIVNSGQWQRAERLTKQDISLTSQDRKSTRIKICKPFCIFTSSTKSDNEINELLILCRNCGSRMLDHTIMHFIKYNFNKIKLI